MNKSQAINDIKINFGIFKMFKQEDILEALLLNDAEELEKMRIFYADQKRKLSKVETSINEGDEKTVAGIVGTFKRDVYRIEKTKV